MLRKHTFAVFLLLFAMLVSSGAMADLDDRSAGAFDQSAPAHQEPNAEPDQDFLALFRTASLSLNQAIAIAERLHAGSRVAAITFDISSTPAYRVRTVKNKEIWENVIDVSTGRSTRPELALSLNELKAEERDNIVALRSVEQELSDAVAIAEKATVGKAISGGLVKESDHVNFVVVVLSDDRVKEVFLEPPRALSKGQNLPGQVRGAKQIKQRQASFSCRPNRELPNLADKATALCRS
jgi:uncharacterized membrane protein YkoI